VEREGVGSRPTRQRRRPTSWWSGSSSGERSGACMSTIPGSLTGGAVDGLNQPGHYSSWVGPNPFKPIIFYEFKLAQICKLQNLVFHCRKNTQTFHEARLEYSKQLSQLGQLHILNTIYAIISNRLQFETSLNFKGVQTSWEKSGKFTKILTQHDLHKSEFSWSHLYAKVAVLTQASK
jgi:hypothetical protein